MLFPPTKKRIALILFAVLFAVNILTALFLFTDIQMLTAPKTTIYVDILEVNADELVLTATIEMENTNPFSLSLHDFTITSMTIDDQPIGTLSLPNGEIPAETTKSFTAQETIDFAGADTFRVLKNIISGRLGITLFGFIHKTIPLEIIVIASIDELLNSIHIPTLRLETSFDELTEQGLHFSARVEVYNPNTIEFHINKISVTVLNEQEIEVGSLDIYGSSIQPENSGVFESEGTLLFETIDASVLTFQLEGIAGATIAGINKSVSFSTAVDVTVPDITEFLLLNETIDFKLPVQFKLRPNGLLGTVGFSIYNPSNIPLIGKNLLCSIYRQDGDQRTLLGQKHMSACQIPSKQEVCVKTEILMPYRTVLFAEKGQVIPNNLILQIEGDFSLAGTRQVLPISIEAFVDPHLFRSM